MHVVEAKGILSAGNGMNTYRGCSHGCIYCDSRSKCYQMNHDFENVEVKGNAKELLEGRLKSKRNKCMIGTGSMSDPYNHYEEKFRITRGCLEVINKYGFGVTLITKSNRILEDIDLLKEINDKTKAVVQITLTTIDDELCKKIEPNVCPTSDRFKVLMKCKELGIPTVVWLSPILPFINDSEENIRGILDLCVKADVKGIICFGMGVTLREGSREYFYQKLDELFPGLKDKYIRRFGNAYVCGSNNNDLLMDIFYKTCKKHHIMSNPEKIFAYLKEFPEKETFEQLGLF